MDPPSGPLSANENAVEPIPEAIDGVFRHPFIARPDERGCLFEIYRQAWQGVFPPVQWNCVRSEGNVLRGVHVHLVHTDYLIIVHGRAEVGLADLRAGSPTEGRAQLLSLEATKMSAVTIPVGVAHGFYFPEPSVFIYAVSHYWNKADELGCRWDDPQLGIPWTCSQPVISPRDAMLGTLAELAPHIPPFVS